MSVNGTIGQAALCERLRKKTIRGCCREIAAQLKALSCMEVSTAWVGGETGKDGCIIEAAGTVNGKTPVITAFLPGTETTMYTERLEDTKPVVPENNDIKVHLLNDEIVVTARVDLETDEPDMSGAATAIGMAAYAAWMLETEKRQLRRGLRIYITFAAHALQKYVQQHPMVLNRPMLGQIDLTGNSDGLQVLPGTLPNFLQDRFIRALGKGHPLDVYAAEPGMCLFGLPPAGVPAMAVAPEAVYCGALAETLAFALDADLAECRRAAKQIVKDALQLVADDAGYADGAQAILNSMVPLVKWMEFLPSPQRIRKLRKEKGLVKGYLGKRNAFTLEVAAWGKELKAAAGTPVAGKKAVMGKRLAAQAETMIPQKAFVGYAGFADLTPAQKRTLKNGLKINPDKPVPDWVQAALDAATGRKPVTKIYAALKNAGYAVSADRLVKLYELMGKAGKVTFAGIVRKKDMLVALRKAGVKKGDTIMAHTGLNAFGYIPGGPNEMIEALLESVGPEGTVCMPAHSVSWVSHFPFDPATSRSIAGVISNLFIKWPGAIRSLHPTHSVTAVGPKAKWLTETHTYKVAPQGKKGFWGRFVESGGKTVMFCGSLPSNTLLHAVDLWAGVPLPTVPVHFMQNGKRVEKNCPGVPYHTTTNQAIHNAMYKKGQIKTAKLGSALVYVMTGKDAVETGMPIVRRNILKATQPGCGCHYCKHVKRVVKQRKARKAK